jgi:Uncharacterized protein conserved in bacteria (DUF2169)/Pentapeptide repeats (8 copies)
VNTFNPGARPGMLAGRATPVPLPWPIPVTPLAPVACGSVLWRKGGAPGVTIVVKATFGLVHEATARLVAPAEIVREDRYRNNGACLDEASELSPYLPGAGVILSGMAYAPAGQPAPAVSVRLGLFRERPLLNKVLHVVGFRPRESPGSPRPFDRMPIVYERAAGGPGIDDNPVGTGAAPGSPLPNVLDPRSPQSPAGFGPVARHWGSRYALAPALIAGAAEAPPLHDARFDRADLRDIAAGKADLSRCRFGRADLHEAMLRGARLTGASFAHAQLDGADLRDADLEGANVFGASRETAKLGANARGLVEIDEGSAGTEA